MKHHLPLSLTSPQGIWETTKDIHDIQREHVLTFYLDTRQRVLKKQTVAIGSLNQTILEARDIFAEAMQTPCASIILAHNHPSNDPQPSDADRSFTLIIQTAGDLLGIPLLDHVIVCKSGFFSFREHRLL